jgi:hypothetical protein
MENSSDSSNTNPKPDNTRAGGPDETRGAGGRGSADATPDVTRAGGPDETRAGGEGNQAQEQVNTPRGAPSDSRSAPR